MNRTQKKIITVMVPVMILVTALGIASAVGYQYNYKSAPAFNWGQTWWVWLLALALITWFGYKMSKDQGHD